MLPTITNGAPGLAHHRWRVSSSMGQSWNRRSPVKCGKSTTAQCQQHQLLLPSCVSDTQPHPRHPQNPLLLAPHWPRGLKTWQEGGQWAGFQTAEPGSESRGLSPHATCTPLTALGSPHPQQQ